MDNQKLEKAVLRGERAESFLENKYWTDEVSPSLDRRLSSYLDSLRIGLSQEDYWKTLGRIEELENLINKPDRDVKSALNAVKVLDEQ